MTVHDAAGGAPRILRVTTLYPEYLDAFYGARPGLADEPYAAQREQLDADFFGWADSWRAPMAAQGWDFRQIEINAAPLQRAWAREHAVKATRDFETIAIEQVKATRPDVLWYDHEDPVLLQALRAAAGPSLGAVVGWLGSPVARSDAWPQMDLMLTCAPEVAERCRRGGLDAEVLPHAFDPRILERLDRGEPGESLGVTFVGQLVAGREFHESRLRLLAEVAREVPLTLFVPRPRPTWRSRVRRLLSGASRRLPPELGEVRDGVYGLRMYAALRASRATLNIHADSSPRFASNMRLYEATGAGVCLVTDWRENLPQLFEPDREVVTYRDALECGAVLRRLLDRPDEAKAIGAAGQRRTLATHTFAHRAPLLDEILRRVLRSRARAAVC